MTKWSIALAVIAFALAGCSGKPESTPPEAAPEAASAPAPSEVEEEIPMTDLQAVKIGPYDVQPMFEEELSDGHFNIRITGGDVAAVREWVGPADASGVVVVKTIIERDYYHGHVEMPDPIPADARLWIEIETPTGERLKGSVPLQP